MSSVEGKPCADKTPRDLTRATFPAGTVSGAPKNSRRTGAKKPAGGEDRYRYRVGAYRIIYEIHDKVLMVLILAVGDRKEIYR